MNPSDDDIGRMQQEAVRRVRDMQQRAKNMSAARTVRQQQAPQQHEKLPENSEPEPLPEPPKQSEISDNKKPNDILEGFFKDKEKSLILLLLVLLSGEDDNNGIMLALLYLLI